MTLKLFFLTDSDVSPCPNLMTKNKAGSKCGYGENSCNGRGYACVNHKCYKGILLSKAGKGPSVRLIVLWSVK